MSLFIECRNIDRQTFPNQNDFKAQYFSLDDFTKKCLRWKGHESTCRLSVYFHSYPEHCWRDEQRRHAGDRGTGRDAPLWRNRDSEVRSVTRMIMIVTVMMTRPTITWRREDGEKIRMCEHQFSEEDNCEEVAEHTGDSLTLINLNRHVMIQM